MTGRATPFWIAAAIFAVDRTSKYWIEKSVDFFDVHPVIPGFFQIVHTRNKGIAFGVFNDSASPGVSWLLVAFSISVLGYIAYLLWQHSQTMRKEHWTLTLGLSLVLGGALGNVFDRVVFGSVTDFLDFYWGSAHFPVFNVADSAITVGACLLLINLWQNRRVSEAHS